MSRHYAFWYAFLALLILIPVIVSATTNEAMLWTAYLPLVLLAVILPPIVIWLLQKMGFAVGKAVSCPKCGAAMPLFRKPTSVRQGMFGGYTCPACGTEMDAAGRPMS